MKTVLVTKRSIVNPKTRLASITSATPKVCGIKATYDDGRVLTTSGDVWKVEKRPTDQADYITVA